MQGQSSSTESTAATSGPGPYKCSNCSRLFKTRRARGGHQIAHRKAKEMGKAYGPVLAAVLIHHVPSDDEEGDEPAEAVANQEGTGSSQNRPKVVQTENKAKGSESVTSKPKRKAAVKSAKPRAAKTGTSRRLPNKKPVRDQMPDHHHQQPQPQLQLQPQPQLQLQPQPHLQLQPQPHLQLQPQPQPQPQRQPQPQPQQLQPQPQRQLQPQPQPQQLQPQLQRQLQPQPQPQQLQPQPQRQLQPQPQPQQLQPQPRRQLQPQPQPRRQLQPQPQPQQLQPQPQRQLQPQPQPQQLQPQPQRQLQPQPQPQQLQPQPQRQLQPQPQPQQLQPQPQRQLQPQPQPQQLQPQPQRQLQPQPQPQQLFTKDFLGEWSPICNVTYGAETSKKSSEKNPLNPAARAFWETDDDDLNLELQLCSRNVGKLDLELKLGF